MRYIFIVSFLLMAFGTAYSQGKRKKGFSKPKNANEQFLQTQFWIGFKGGLNLSRATPETTYSTFSSIDYSSTELLKEYEDWKDKGTQTGLEFTFYHRRFSLSFYPNYSRFNFSYGNNYEYSSISDPGNILEVNYRQKQHLEYVDLPLVIKYDLLKGNLRPFIHLGGYYGVLLNANKEIRISGTDQASGASEPFKKPPVIVGADDLFTNSSIGLIGGTGVTYDNWNIRLSLEFNYRMGLNNITSAANRYSDNRLAGSGDALDDMTLDNITINLGFLFPLRFISKNFSSDL